MKIYKDILWTWLLPEIRREIDMDEWLKHGGKWIIFDSRDRIVDLAERLKPLIESGEIESAKYWNEDPSAICVYSLDKDKWKLWEILKGLGAGDSRVWEYDYAWGKNVADPVNFMYSWFSKFSTILRSYGLTGTLRLIREMLKPGRN